MGSGRTAVARTSRIDEGKPDRVGARHGLGLGFQLGRGLGRKRERKEKVGRGRKGKWPKWPG